MRSVHTALICRPVLMTGARVAVSSAGDSAASRQAMLCVWLASPWA